MLIFAPHFVSGVWDFKDGTAGNMDLTLENYTTTLSAELLSKAKKAAVRECDELEKGHFQAYVDEQDKTFDTYIKVNRNGEITGSGCDCLTITPFCHHQAALLLFVIKGKKTLPKLKGGKKVNNIETMVHEADPEKLKAWLIGLLTEHKDLSMTFLYEFSKSNGQHDPQELKQLTLDAVKAIIKTKRSIDSTHGKKIIDLWMALHEPVITDFCVQLADEDSFLRMHALMEACEQVQEKYGDFNSRITKHLEKLLLKVVNPLVQIKDEEVWDKIVERFADKIHGGPYYVRIYYLKFLTGVHQLSVMERRRSLATALVTQFMKVDVRSFYDGTKYTIGIFDIVVNSGMFEEYCIIFQPIRYQNDYNCRLIAQLMELDMYALAEHYCLEQIEANSNDQYDRAYLEFLAEIYTIEKEDKKLAGVLQTGLSYTYDFNTYLFVESQMEESEEKKKWRNQLLASARREAGYNYSAMLFTFQLLDHEQNYSRMFDYLDATARYEVIARFAEKLAIYDIGKFLKTLLYKSDNINADDNREVARLQPFFEELLKVCLKRYSTDELNLIIKERLKDRRFYGPNLFLAFMKIRLSLV